MKTALSRDFHGVKAFGLKNPSTLEGITEALGGEYLEKEKLVFGVVYERTEVTRALTLTKGQVTRADGTKGGEMIYETPQHIRGEEKENTD